MLRAFLSDTNLFKSISFPYLEKLMETADVSVRVKIHNTNGSFRGRIMPSSERAA